MRLFLVLLGLAACIPSHTPSQETLAETLARETVALVDDGDVYCSGVWVGTHEILTASHCTAREEELVPLGSTVAFATESDATIVNGQPRYAERPAKLVARDKDRDLALLRTEDEPEHGVASPSRDEPRPGERAYAEGAPLGMGWSFSAGEVAAIRIAGATGMDDGLLAYVQATTPISPGSSGCGLYDEDGELIGIARAYARGGENLNLFVHRDHIVSFLANVHAGMR